jgi:uncharacterized cupredoxin-like copper-binding protein
MKRILYLIGLILAVGVISIGLTGMTTVPQANQPVEVNVILKEFSMEMSRTDLPAGVPIKFNFIQKGSVNHEAVLEIAGVNDEPLELSGKESEAEDIVPGETRSMVWTIPNPGKYQLACHVPGHYEGGMVTTFTISKPGLLSGLLANPIALATLVLILAAILVGMISYLIIQRRKGNLLSQG